MVQQPTTRDLDILARTLYAEARGEIRGQDDTGILAVAAVIINRANSGDWGNSISSVCLAPRQFSCWNSNDPNYPEIRPGATPSETAAFAKCQAIARQVISGQYTDPTGGATYYHTKNCHPSWDANVVKTKEIGNHVFFRPPGDESHLASVCSAESGGTALVPATLAAAFAQVGQSHPDDSEWQCGQFISTLYRQNGGDRTVTDIVSGHSGLQVDPAHVTTGTLVFWPTNGGIEQHFAQVYLDAQGVARVVESTTAGQPAGMRRIRSDRTLDEITKNHGVQPLFFQLPGQKLVPVNLALSGGPFEFEQPYDPWPATDDEKIRFLTESTFKDTQTGVKLNDDGSMQIGQMLFTLSLDAQNKTDHSTIEPANQQANPNAYVIKVANMSSNWSRFSVIQKMAETAHMDAGALQLQIAEAMILKGDESYYKFLQSMPTGPDAYHPHRLDYGYGSLKNKTPAQFATQQASHRAIAATRNHGSNPQADIAALTGTRGGQAVNFSRQNGAEDLNHTLRQAYQELIQEHPALATGYYRNKTLVADGTPISRDLLNGKNGTVEIIGVRPGMDVETVKEMLYGRAAMEQALSARSVAGAENVVAFTRPLTPA